MAVDDSIESSDALILNQRAEHPSSLAERLTDIRSTDVNARVIWAACAASGAVAATRFRVSTIAGRRTFMTSKSLKWTAALLALGLGAGTVSAAEPSQSAQQPTQQELMQQLNELKAKVAAMENNQASALAKYDSRDVDATVAAVLKDADRHSLLIDGGVMTGGWDKSKMGFFLGSEDGSSYFHPGIVWWYRGVANYRQGASKDSTTTGFENSLLKPYLDGTLFTKDFAYKFQWTFNKADAPSCWTMRTPRTSLRITRSWAATLRSRPVSTSRRLCTSSTWAISSNWRRIARWPTSSSAAGTSAHACRASVCS
jgi:hypothetical protein